MSILPRLQVFFGNKKIEFSDFMVFRDADHFVKESGRIGDPWKYAFDIQFTGEADERVFKGTVTDAAGKQMEFQGLYDTVKELDLEAMTPERIETVNKLKKLLAISSLSTQPETVPQAQNADGTTPPEQKIWPDLAQREADRIFGRVSAGVSGRRDAMLTDRYSGRSCFLPASMTMSKRSSSPTSSHSTLPNSVSSRWRPNISAKSLFITSSVNCSRLRRSNRKSGIRFDPKSAPSSCPCVCRWPSLRTRNWTRFASTAWIPTTKNKPSSSARCKMARTRSGRPATSKVTGLP